MARPTQRQLVYLKRGEEQPGGKLPLFDEYGQEFGLETIRSCIKRGWAEPWFENPIKPEWVICRITKAGLMALATGGNEEFVEENQEVD